MMFYVLFMMMWWFWIFNFSITPCSFTAPQTSRASVFYRSEQS